MKRIDLGSVAVEAKNNQEIADLINDAVKTIDQAHRLEKQLGSDRVFGNNTLSVEAQVDAVYTQTMINRCYDIARYDCIEELNELIGGNVVDMTGTDKQVCRRFYFTYRKLAAAL